VIVCIGRTILVVLTLCSSRARDVASSMINFVVKVSVVVLVILVASVVIAIVTFVVFGDADSSGGAIIDHVAGGSAVGFVWILFRFNFEVGSSLF